nr:FtsX-like permease family protein [uncultured Faecalimonas sp.]
MSLIDLLRMSSGNLKRRKLRTFLTVLGVVIGTASIVVMISLGLGMQKSMYQQVEESGGLTSIEVTGKTNGGSGVIITGDMMQEDQESEKYITDEAIEELAGLEHVRLASPVLSMSAMILKGNYEGYVDLRGMRPEALQEQNIPLAEGSSLPKAGTSNLELVIGNLIPEMLYEKNTGKGYWETGKLPDIDYMNDPLFLILDADAYMASKGSGTSSLEQSLGKSEGQNGNQTATKAPKKYVVHASGMVKGDLNTYNSHSYYVYCDLDTLISTLKREYGARPIPGQPTTKSGKPYKEFVYSSASVQVDDIDNVEAVSAKIREMGYTVSSNAEYLKSMQSQFAIIQAVLGGIGAVSLLVAAIGIANTMMMSIYERTKEIGVIKVLGCSLRNIKQMFLIEAGFIGLLGGVIGNLLSMLLSFGINTVAGSMGSAMGFEGDISYIPVWLVLASLGFAIFVGMAAGYFPALRAMRLSPLAAIRNE